MRYAGEETEGEVKKEKVEVDRETYKDTERKTDY